VNLKYIMFIDFTNLNKYFSAALGKGRQAAKTLIIFYFVLNALFLSCSSIADA